ncbi:MAG TPA: Wzy polymerase domain-containing protein [Burkholderiales bacterium]|nr:Wzy polymerase domain-containing protein [Burkholderiales bacterium]
MWVLPFLQPHRQFPLPSFYTEWLAFALGLAALSLLLQKRHWNEPEFPRVGLVPLALGALLLLQLTLGKIAYAEQALLAVAYLLWMAFLVLLGNILRREIGLADTSTTLAWCLVAGGVLSAIVGVLQHYQLHTLIDPLVGVKTENAVFGNLAQRNHFADYTCLALASLVFLYSNRRLNWAVAAVLAVLLLFVLALSSSRSAWLFLFALLALSAWWYWKDRKSRALLRTCILLVSGFGLMQWVVKLSWLAAPMPAVTSIDKLYDFASGNIRLELWQEAWHIFLQSPLLGVGWGQFTWQHFLYGVLLKSHGLSGLYNHAHNIVMQLLAETGLVGTLLIVVGTTIWLHGLRRMAFDIHLWWLLALLAVIGIHSMLEFPLWYSHFLGIAAVLLGLGETRFYTLEMQRVGRISFALMLVLGWVSAISLVYSYRNLEETLFAKGLEKLDAAGLKRLNEDLLEIHRTSLLAPYIELAYTGAIVLNKEHLSDKLELNSRVMHFVPVSMVVYQQAILLALDGQAAAAKTQLERAAVAYPDELGNFAKVVRFLLSQDPAELEPLLELSEQKLKEKGIGVRAK